MRILHVSDLHVGLLMNNFSLREDHEHILAQIVSLMDSLDVDALAVAGDLYDRSNPSAESVGVVDRFLAAAVNTGRAVFVTYGNHDSPERIGYASGLLNRQGLYLSPAFDREVRHYTIEDKDGPVVFWLIPFLRPSTVRHFFPDAQINSSTDAIRTVIDSLPLDPTVRNVALSHQFVVGSGFDPSVDIDSDKSRIGLASEGLTLDVQVGGIDFVDASVYDPFDYVALGHVHRAYSVGRNEVRYSGSPLRFSLSDAELASDKYALLVDIGAKEHDGKTQVKVQEILLHPLHDVRAIRGTLEELTSEEVVSAAPADDYLRVTLTDERTPVDARIRLRAHYPNVMQVIADNAYTRASGMRNQTANVEERSPKELFAELFERQVGRPMSRTQAQEFARALARAQDKNNDTQEHVANTDEKSTGKADANDSDTGPADVSKKDANENSVTEQAGGAR